MGNLGSGGGGVEFLIGFVSGFLGGGYAGAKAGKKISDIIEEN